MVFVSRRIAYPFFTVVVLIVFFCLLYLGFFSQALVADIGNSSVSIIGSEIVINVPLENKSNHIVDHVNVIISDGNTSNTTWLKGDEASSVMQPGERFDYNATIPLGESYTYTAVITAPFNRPINISIPLEPTTVDPVSAEVTIAKNMVVDRTYSEGYSVKLCNNSESDLSEVGWIENADVGDFRESFYERVISLDKHTCQTIYSSLTPIRSGEITLGFTLRVGSMKKQTQTVLNIAGESGVVMPAPDFNENAPVDEGVADSNVMGDVVPDENIVVEPLPDANGPNS